MQWYNWLHYVAESHALLMKNGLKGHWWHVKKCDSTWITFKIEKKKTKMYCCRAQTVKLLGAFFFVVYAHTCVWQQLEMYCSCLQNTEKAEDANAD